jgi:transcriptional regulator with GAF, ATPase, and Fis domain
MSPKRTPPAGSAKHLDESTFAKHIDRLLSTYGPKTEGRVGVPRNAAATPTVNGREVPFEVPFAEATRRWQRQRVMDALEAFQEDGTWNISASSRALGLPRSQVYRLMRRLRISNRATKLKRKNGG